MAYIHEEVSPQLLYRWPEIFQTHRDIDYTAENVSLFEALEGLGATEDPINRLMSHLKEIDSCPYRKNEVANFCVGADIPSLEKKALTDNARVALIDETNDGVAANCIPSGLTLYELYKALGKKVRRIVRFVSVILTGM